MPAPAICYNPPKFMLQRGWAGEPVQLIEPVLWAPVGSLNVVGEPLIVVVPVIVVTPLIAVAPVERHAGRVGPGD